MKRLKKKDIVDLGVKVYSYGNDRENLKTFYNTSLSYDAMHETLREQFRMIVGDGSFYQFEREKLLLFEIMTEIIDEVIPKNVIPSIGRFAEVKTVAQGVKPEFKSKIGRRRAKGFITKAGMAGNYDVFRLDTNTIEIPTVVYGGACQVSIEQFLDGTADFSELLKIVMDEIENSIYREVRYAIESFAIKMPVQTNNKHVVAGWDGEAMASLLKTIRSYGNGAQILCTETLAQKIRTEADYISDRDKDDIRDRGYLGRFLGADVILLPNAYEDNSNRRMTFQDRYAYVLPTGGVSGATEKIIKVALEGKTMIKDFDNKGDWSKEVQVYKKMGIGMVTDTPYIGIYEDTNIPYVERPRF